MKTNDAMLAGMREALSLLQSDGPVAATAKIRQTLSAAMPTDARADNVSARPPRHDGDSSPLRIADGIGEAGEYVADLLARLGIAVPADAKRFGLPVGAPGTAAPADGRASAPGEFLAGSFSDRAGTRAYKLYVPTAYRGQPLPLVTMLHGCMQTPDDFAAGTRLNALAEELPCLVLYPAQSRSANASLAWDWFNATDRQRGRGESSLIAGMTLEILDRYGLDPTRVYIAGLSAGGAMAAVMGALYPELYAAIGVHSGMPYATASDWTSALAAMQCACAETPDPAAQWMPAIVLHGDRDETVHPGNGERIATQCLPPHTTLRVVAGQAPGGYAYTQSIHEDSGGTPVVEHWLMHGAGHAWLGGSRLGSFTDSKGPDASREMMRFFALHSKPARRSSVSGDGTDHGGKGG